MAKKTATRRIFHLYDQDEVIIQLVAEKLNADETRDKDSTESDALRQCIRGSMKKFGITKADLALAIKERNAALQQEAEAMD